MLQSTKCCLHFEENAYFVSIFQASSLNMVAKLYPSLIQKSFQEYKLLGNGIFYTILNVATINAYIIYKINQNKEIKNKRNFIKILALQLTQEHIKYRSKLTCLPREIRKHTSELIAQNDLDEASTSTWDLQQKKKKETCVKSSENFRKRCYICKRKKNRMNRNIYVYRMY